MDERTPTISEIVARLPQKLNQKIQAKTAEKINTKQNEIVL